MLSLFCSQVNPGAQCFISLEKYRHPTAALTDAVWIQAAGKKNNMLLEDAMCFSIQHESHAQLSNQNDLHRLSNI